jgi:chromate transporter
MFTIGGGYAIATLLIWQFGLSPIYIVLTGILGGLVYTLWLKEKIMNKEV